MVLRVKNRTENWKTARNFAPFLKNKALLLSFTRRLGEPAETCEEDVHLELFWTAMRDYVYGQKQQEHAQVPSPKGIAELYNRGKFADLRDRVKEFGERRGAGNLRNFADLGSSGYRVSCAEDQDKLANNLLKTEIDIVIESPSRLYIGEAKSKCLFGANGSRILVHQVIRQYVMASILLEILECHKKVIPFVVVEDKTRPFRQVEFMKEQRWMHEDHVLEWSDVKQYTGVRAAETT